MPVPPRKHKFRIWFSKTGNLRFISHHDLMRLIHRAVRRAHLPVTFSHGFNPRPRISFHAPLAVSQEGRRELLEIQLETDLDPAGLHSSLAAQLPPGLRILDAEKLHPNKKTRVASFHYSLHFPDPLPPRHLPLSSPFARRTADKATSQKPPLPDYLQSISLEGRTLRFSLKVNDGRSLRPREVLQLLGLEFPSTSKQPRIVRDAVEIAD